ncbi:hypothetical protein NIZ92_06445 [Alcaligenes sp. 1735tsa3]|uniref:hypothetical protein n=1 Tax=Alcaligenes sp. 1735tsa3 TaxID=2953809 RepID=UPI0020A78CE8|nr:hypothetical protein [Alcaligenes sp. 1735tsa3]USY26671.1 hypothetical protein NIZ92_06445 [Alcaligenes sp. 1735tsa3]
MTFTAFGYEFQWLVMLNKFLDGFLPGIGFMMAVILAYLMALWLARKPKPKHRKLRVKLITKGPAQ